ncbi:MAG TPA: secondary thiamine-phosphate synthase enzyme YjbQ [Candidatus Gastranaerophilaceae bacterium]|nr:secondary thiamine-phosphate synthase enzyme YjbQ [Candidatus Gastranaerophilaceae bacterium]HPT40958.1 secondary thiamine-phosphate synthase enzyme YjbQ [Candidatus Gastranaerophilaceae bacterium]
MTVINEKFVVNTKGHTDIIDITKNVQNSVYRHSLQNASVLVYVAGSTVSITNIEFEPGVLVDLFEALERVIPTGIEYHHDATWHDGNGYAHVRAAIVGNSTSVPLIDGALQLGTWQQIVLVDFDNRPRTRTVHVQIVY